MFSNFFPENRVVYEVMWKNIVEPGRPHMTIRRMRFACCLTKVTDTLLEYIIFIAFSWQHGFANSLQCYVICTVPALFASHTGFSSDTFVHSGTRLTTVHEEVGLLIASIWCS